MHTLHTIVGGIIFITSLIFSVIWLFSPALHTHLSWVVIVLPLFASIVFLFVVYELSSFAILRELQQQALDIERDKDREIGNLKKKLDAILATKVEPPEIVGMHAEEEEHLPNKPRRRYFLTVRNRSSKRITVTCACETKAPAGVHGSAFPLILHLVDYVGPRSFDVEPGIEVQFEAFRHEKGKPKFQLVSHQDKILTLAIGKDTALEHAQCTLRFSIKGDFEAVIKAFFIKLLADGWLSVETCKN